jgi:hypothetical protein
VNIYYNNGNVGIGTASPQSSYKLQVQGNSYVNDQLVFSDSYRGGGGTDYACNKISLWGGANTPTTTSLMGFGVAAALEQLEYFSYSHHVFNTGTRGGTNYGTERMRIASNGNIGIGTNNPSSLLHVNGRIICGENVWHGLNTDGTNKGRLYFAQGNTGISYLAGGDNGASGTTIEFRRFTDDARLAHISSGGTIYSYGTANYSDSRIKKDIEDINDDTALNKLLLIQPKTYNYIDVDRNKGFGKVYGFIAQQIREVIPEATTITSSIIPNIYKVCLINNKREIYHSIPLDVAIDTEVLITIDKNGGRYKIKEIYEDYFVIDNDIDSDEAFVFGYNVDDVILIAKDYIFTLNVCATQELHRRIEAQNIIIKSHEDRIKDLEEKVDRLLTNT